MLIDPIYFMRFGTKTRDDQDPINPYKPFPPHEYFQELHNVWMREKFMFIKKSRTMMASWWAAAETLHMVMNHQPSRAIFWAQDEDRATALLDYAWVLYDQMDDQLKAIYPLERPRDQQSFKELELRDGGLIKALPGKDPQKIRSEHPTILVLDEADFIDNGAEAFDVAIASKVPWVLAISTPNPGWMSFMCSTALPIKRNNRRD